MPAPVAAVPAPAAPAAPTNGAAPAAAPAAEPVFKVKVNGELREYKQAEAERLLSKAAFADQAIRQSKEALKATQAEREEREALKKRIKEDKAARDQFLREHGIEPDEFTRERLSEKLREAEMTPEQKRIAELEAAKAEADKKLKAADEEKAQQRLSENAKRIQATIENELDAAWKRADFERGPDAFFAVYEVMQEFVGLGLLDPNQPFSAAMADRIIETARENIDGTDKRREAAVLKGLKGAALKKRLGPETWREVLRYAAEEFRGGGIKPAAPAPAAPAKKEDPGWISPTDLQNKYRGGR